MSHQPSKESHHDPENRACDKNMYIGDYPCTCGAKVLHDYAEGEVRNPRQPSNDRLINKIAKTRYEPEVNITPGAIYTYGQIPGLNAMIRTILEAKDADLNKLINDAYLKGLSDAEMDKLDASRSNEELIEDIIYSSPFCYADRDTKDVNAMRKILMTTLQAVRDAEREKAVAEATYNAIILATDFLMKNGHIKAAQALNDLAFKSIFTPKISNNN